MCIISHLIYIKANAAKTDEHIEELIHFLREVSEGRGTVVGGYVSRCDMDRYKERIEEMRILMADEWRLKL